MKVRLCVGAKLLFLVAALCTTGCTSMRSTLYSHDGCQDCAKVKKHLKGVPTTLEVPTHLRVSVVKTRFGKVDTATGFVTFVPNLETREVCADPVEQKQIFTVDFKRPAAGELKYKLTFDEGQQYIKKVENKSTDETIARVTKLITTIIGTVPTGRVREAEVPAALTPFPEVIASEVFELNEVDLEARIQSFLDTYVNECRPNCPPCTFTAPSPACSMSGISSRCTTCSPSNSTINRKSELRP